MVTYLFRRILLGCLTLVLITMLVYGLIRMMPGDSVSAEYGAMDPGMKINKADEERMREARGLNLPWYFGYFKWAVNVVNWDAENWRPYVDLGQSYREKRPVTTVIGERIGPTLMLSISSLTIAYLLSIPIGLYATARGGRVDERVISTGLYMLYSLPSFVAALLLQSYFAVKLEGTWLELPLHGMHSSSLEYDEFTTAGKVWDIVQHSVLPVICFTYGVLAYESRFIRANMQEVMRQDYIRTARAKGLGPIRVLVHHGFRNSLIPFVTLIGLTLPALLSGAIILEKIFSWPGMGSLMFESITTRDADVTMGLVLIFSIITLLGQLLADLLYAVVDPRVTYS
ncbi:MAG: ABC transporter permease [Planctomycetota bacterium]|nr:ABC transporter permease [Planctomycetota bacterium]